LVNGVRVSSKKGSGKANLFQPSAILDMVVYHSDLKQLQRIKEFKWGYLYQHILSDVLKNAVALFIIELLTKCLKQPEPNEDLFSFTEDVLLHLDASTDTIMANLPLFFALHLSHFFGVTPTPLKNADQQTAIVYFDLQEGEFTNEQPHHPHFVEGRQALVINELLKVRQPEELADIKLNYEIRRRLLAAMEIYYSLHIQDFGTMRTLPVLKEILS
ncbi:MAG: DNA repair protein RecO C-terminal domain-containing protein, partial [Bacteroidetes bacterium]|nr:DNA repair protein RecO C-terminal domain-containing protein [Bacteroidota bacterium]